MAEEIKKPVEAPKTEEKKAVVEAAPAPVKPVVNDEVKELKKIIKELKKENEDLKRDKEQLNNIIVSLKTKLAQAVSDVENLAKRYTEISKYIADSTKMFTTNISMVLKGGLHND